MRFFHSWEKWGQNSEEIRKTWCSKKNGRLAIFPKSANNFIVSSLYHIVLHIAILHYLQYINIYVYIYICWSNDTYWYNVKYCPKKTSEYKIRVNVNRKDLHMEPKKTIQHRGPRVLDGLPLHFDILLVTCIKKPMAWGIFSRSI